MTEKDKKEFTFMSEQVRKKPIYKRKGFIRGCQIAALAVLFGGVAGVTFAITMPWAEKHFGQPEDPEKIVIMQDETQVTEQIGPETETQTETEVQTEVKETEPPVPQIVERKELELSDYKQLHAKMSAVADEAAKSIVTVTGASSNVDFFNEVIENNVQASGLVIEISQQDLFILTEETAIGGAERIFVTFKNGATAEAALQKKDWVSGMAVIKVPLASLDEETKLTYQKPSLSGTAMVRQGDPVIAVGTPVSNSNSMAPGTITSCVDTPTVDEEYRVLTTDIIGSSQGSGILINLDGMIVGIIAQNFGADSEQITLTALALPDIKELIQALANGEEWTYMGITGKEVTESVAGERGIPRGIYIRGVAENSPAMLAGINVGTDILVSIDGEEILSMDAYVKELQKHEPDKVVTVGLKRSTLEGYVDWEVSVTLGRG